MAFETAPTAFNRIVLAMIRWVISQTDAKAILMGKPKQPLHELGAPTMVFRSIIQVDHQGGNLRKAAAHRLPPVAQSIDQTIAGELGGQVIDEQLVAGWKQNPKRRQRGRRLEIVVARFGGRPAFATTRKRTDLHGGFGID